MTRLSPHLPLRPFPLQSTCAPSSIPHQSGAGPTAAPGSSSPGKHSCCVPTSSAHLKFNKTQDCPQCAVYLGVLLQERQKTGSHNWGTGRCIILLVLRGIRPVRHGPGSWSACCPGTDCHSRVQCRALETRAHNSPKAQRENLASISYQHVMLGNIGVYSGRAGELGCSHLQH